MMIVLAVIFSVIIVVSQIRFGVRAEYGDSGITVTAFFGFIKLKIYPRIPGKHGVKPKKEKSAKKPKRIEDPKPGLADNFKRVSPAVFKTLGRIKRRLLIKELKIYYVAASENAAFTALSFGAANAFFGMLTAQLETHFRLKERDFRSSADFNAEKASVYICAAFSLAVWESFYIALAILPVLLEKRGRNSRKEVKNYGQASNR